LSYFASDREQIGYPSGTYRLEALITGSETMLMKSSIAFAFVCWIFLGSTNARASDCEDVIAQYMTAQALLTAHLVAISEKAGMKPTEINAMLKDIAEKSVIDEVWITDSSGHAYLTNTGIDFTFSSDPAKQPQASEFWALINGQKTVVIQQARKREIDDQIFKYVGVAGIDKPRIVQVGVNAEHLSTCR